MDIEGAQVCNLALVKDGTYECPRTLPDATIVSENAALDKWGCDPASERSNLPLIKHRSADGLSIFRMGGPDLRSRHRFHLQGFAILFVNLGMSLRALPCDMSLAQANEQIEAEEGIPVRITRCWLAAMLSSSFGEAVTQ